MSYDAFAPTGRFPQPAGRVCSACGRTEPDAGARFCGVCGSALHQPSAHDASAPSPAAATTQFPSATIDYHDPAAHAPAPALAVAPAYTAPGYVVPAVAAAPARYAVPYVGFGALARVGAAVSAAFSLLPCLLFAFAGSWLIHWLRDTLDFWSGQQVRLPVIGSLLGSSLNLNFVSLLRLDGLYQSVTYWDDRLVMAFALLWLVPWVLAILGGAVFAGILALVYNAFGRLSGGVDVEIVQRR